MAQLVLDSPVTLLHYQLRTALTMEADSLAALADLAKAAKSKEVKDMFRHHSDETQEQVENLHNVFALMELKDTSAPSPSTKGISRQAESLIGKSATKVRDQVTLSCALGNEHYEISAYQGLIIPAVALGASEAVTLLQANLEQEIHTSEELADLLQKIVAG
jgi:ferritin-like metal-binding protein YciE